MLSEGPTEGRLSEEKTYERMDLVKKELMSKGMSKGLSKGRFIDRRDWIRKRQMRRKIT